MLLNVRILSKDYSVEVTWKKMKKVRLKVFSNGEIKLSVPFDTPEKWVYEFIEKRRVG